MAQIERDAALVRVSRVRRWTIGAAAALTAGFAALVSAIAPGHSLGAGRSTHGQTPPSASGSTSRESPRPKLPPLARPSQLGLEGPSSSPQSAPPPTQQSSPPATQQSSPPPTQQASPAPTPQAAPPPAQSGATSGGS